MSISSDFLLARHDAAVCTDSTGSTDNSFHSDVAGVKLKALQSLLL